MADLVLHSSNDYKAIKSHPCSAQDCKYGQIIKPGDRYRRFVYEAEDGTFTTEKIHLACLYDKGI